MEKIKVVLVDDHKIFRDGIKSLLSDDSNIEIVADFSTCQELYDYLKNNSPDLIVLDITLNESSGIEISKSLKQTNPEIKIMILSMHTKEEFVMNAIKAGVRGYMSKDSSREEFLEAINTIYRGGEYFSKTVSESFIKNYTKKFQVEQEVMENKELTKREMEILRLIASGSSAKEISEKLFISIKTVDCHKSNIFQKLKLKNTAELVHFAIKNKIIEI